MIKNNNNNNKLARNSNRPEIKLSHSVMVGLLYGGVKVKDRGSIAQVSTLLASFLPVFGGLAINKCYRLFSTSAPACLPLGNNSDKLVINSTANTVPNNDTITHSVIIKKYNRLGSKVNFSVGKKNINKRKYSTTSALFIKNLKPLQGAIKNSILEEGIHLDVNNPYEYEEYEELIREREEERKNELDKYNNKVERKILSSYELRRTVFNKLEYILQNEPLNSDTQLKIEAFVYSQVGEFLIEKGDNQPLLLGVKTSGFTSKFNELCITKIEEFNIYLNNLRNELNSSKSLSVGVEELKNSQIMDYYIKTILNELPNKDITDLMLYTLCLIVTFNNNTPDEETQSPVTMLNNSINLGRNLTGRYFRSIYKEYLKVNPDTTFSLFKKDFLQSGQNSILSSDEFYLKLGSLFIEIMVTCSLLAIKVVTEKKNQSSAILKISDEVSSSLDRKNPVLAIPFNLPMIVKPNPYSESKLGGYLLNDVEYSNNLIVDKLSYNTTSKIDKNNIIYETVNKLMKTPFKINEDLLNYLLNQNHIHNLLIDPDYVHTLENKVDRTKSEEKLYQEFLSKKILEEYVIEIARTYSKVPEIYFPIKLDNRGRLYPIPVYLNYQGSELAKALILFAHPDTIQRTDTIAIEYLKAYGANCYGNGLNRKSYTDKINWVNTNWERILDFENSGLIAEADNKYLFISFCFEMRRFNSYLNNVTIQEFKTYLPIQLDGTCNGFQHLALLCNETNLFESLNLARASKSDTPKDFYEAVVNQIIIYLKDKLNSTNSSLELLESCRRLLKLDIKRSTIKTAIMTIPYNATSTTLIKYILKNLNFSHGDNNTLTNSKGEIENKYLGWYNAIDSNGNYNLVSYKDIELLVKCINEIIYINYPKIKLLTNYLKDMTNILNDLNLPIIWRLPTGLVISQQYLKRYSKQIKPFKNIKTAITLTFTDKIKTDTRKQKTALMPNIVHSLDSSVLLLLYNSFSSCIPKNKIVNFYSVHDCYGVSAKYVEDLISILKTIYIELYSDSIYIQKFDKDLINLILTTHGNTSSSYDDKNRIIHIDGKTIKLPEINPLIECKDKPLWYNSLSESKFLVK